MMMTTEKVYKWSNPQEWLQQYIDGLSYSELLQEAKNLASMLDADQIQDAYQSDMDAQGYFKEIGKCSCSHSDWQHAREGDARLEAEDYEIGQCYVKDCDCYEFDGGD